MTLSELATTLESTGLPVAYDFFPEEAFVSYPFIVYREVSSQNMLADGITYHIIRNMVVELYTKTKDTVSEGKVETALSSVFWNKEEEYIDDEKCYQVAFSFKI